MIKDFSISFSRAIIVQDFETVTFYVLFVYKPTFSVIFCWMKRLRVSSQFNSLFILYISTAKPLSLVRGFIAWLKFLYEQSVRFPASFPCLSFPVPFLYIARTKAVLTGLKAY